MKIVELESVRKWGEIRYSLSIYPLEYLLVFPIEKILSILFQMNVFERKREKISFYIYNESIKTVGG